MNTASSRDLLLDMGCPAELHEAAFALLVRCRNKLRNLYGAGAPLGRADDVLTECLDDPAGVVADGAADDLLGDLDAEAREFAALVVANKRGVS